MHGGGLVKFFKQHERHPAVCINWVRFDGGGHETMPKSGYVIENYTRVRKNTGGDKTIKTVVQPLEVRYCTVHWHVYKRFRKAVDESGKLLRGLWGTLKKNATAACSTRIIRINHYASKSKEEYLGKIKRGHPDKVKLGYSEGAWNYPEWKDDNVMQEAAAALREKGVPETYSSAGSCMLEACSPQASCAAGSAASFQRIGHRQGEGCRRGRRDNWGWLPAVSIAWGSAKGNGCGYYQERLSAESCKLIYKEADCVRKKGVVSK